jgi:hypothetical protein
MVSYGKRTNRTVLSVICFVLILLGQGKSSLACSCTVHPICDPHRYLDADFIGEVISSEMVDHQPTDDWPGILVQVRVLERFRGTPKTGEIVKVFTGRGGGDCGFPFKIGNKYLIDAFGKDGVFETHTCTLTAPIEQAEVELRALRAIVAGKKVPNLTGILSKASGFPEGLDNGKVMPFSGIRVSFQPVAGGPALKSTTDSFGSFTFPTFASGRYRVYLDLPDNFSPAWSNFSRWLRDDQLPPLVIKKNRGDSVTCRVEILAETSGSISGIIKVPGNKPTDWTVEADSVDAKDEPQDTVLQTDPASNGAFRLSHLPAGRYSIQFTSRQGFVEGIPLIVDLKEGEQKAGIILTLREQH